MVCESFKNSWLFSNAQTFFSPNSEPILFFHTAKIFFKTVYGLLIWEILKLDLPVCHGSRQDFIWFEENFTLLLHSIYFVEILEIKPWKSAVCAGTASLQDSFERRKLSFLLVYTFFFLMTPWWKGRRVMACSYQ